MQSIDNIQEIIQGCLKKQSRYERALVNKFSGLLYAICKRYMRETEYAKDLLQESLMRIFKNLDKYNAELGSFESWITTITIRQCLTKLNKRKLAVLDIDSFQSSEASVGMDTELLDNHDTKILLRLIGELPDGYRLVFNMAAIDGYSHKEIADTLNINISASRSRLNRAKNILKQRVLTLQNNESWVNTI